jgi:hypothetical protein
MRDYHPGCTVVEFFGDDLRKGLPVGNLDVFAEQLVGDL